MALADERCAPVEAGTPHLSVTEAQELGRETPRWTLGDGAIEREIELPDFREAVAFVNRVADLAEQQDHHPDIHISYKKVRLKLSTHKIGGLSRNDFILAARIDQLG
ncbi:MAG: 4a-hydroxytetrahydrobiopterin dehydratase [Armatimonadota bacterium]|jgi:4a-hydroxytetrahydrobiopterin dehydratase